MSFARNGFTVAPGIDPKRKHRKQTPNVILLTIVAKFSQGCRGHCQHTERDRCRLDAAATRKRAERAVTGKNKGKRGRLKKIDA